MESSLVKLDFPFLCSPAQGYFRVPTPLRVETFNAARTRPRIDRRFYAFMPLDNGERFVSSPALWWHISAYIHPPVSCMQLYGILFGKYKTKDWIDEGKTREALIFVIENVLLGEAD